MTKTFTSIQALEEQIKKDLSKMYRGAAISAFGQIVVSSPIDTGRFRGNWIASINQPSNDVKEKGATDLSSIGRATLNDTLYLTNNLPYAARLAHGYSEQRPDGWIDTILARAREGLQANIKGGDSE